MMAGAPRRPGLDDGAFEPASGGHVAATHRTTSFALLALAAVLLSLVAVLLSLSVAGCARQDGSDDDKQAEPKPTLTLAEEQFSRAATALLAGDREGFLSGLLAGSTAESAAAHDGLGGVFATLSPLPWSSFSFEVEALDARIGEYRITGVGKLGDAGPPDRIAVVREFKLQAVDDGVRVLADKTPEGAGDAYLMALNDPLVLERPGLIVLGEAGAADRAELVMAAAVRGRKRLATLGVDTQPTIVVTVHGSVAAARAALNMDVPASQLTFFSHPAARPSGSAWPIWDVGVTGPWLRDKTDAEVDEALAHELAHAFTMSWFGDDAEPPALLVEGIAQAAEGSPPTAALREEVATGDQLWPLPESFAEVDLWASGDAQAVSLGYQVGGALVRYVVDRWGADHVRPFVQAVAAAEPTEAGMDAALGESLGVTWRQFYAGWKRFVLAGG